MNLLCFGGNMVTCAKKGYIYWFFLVLLTCTDKMKNDKQKKEKKERVWRDLPVIRSAISILLGKWIVKPMQGTMR